MTEKRFYEKGFETGTKSKNQRWRRSSKERGSLLEFLIILLVAFALVFGLVRPFIVEAFYIPSESMVPTLEIGDRVFVNKFIYRFAEPERGDIIVFESIEGSEQDLIKRVVAVPGDTVAVQNGVLFVNGQPQEEPYVNDAFPDGSFFGPTTVPEDAVFVMGDNRGNSRDSRFFGPVSISNVEGEAFITFWPPSHVDLL
jgi:signal peptidase I